MKYLGAVFLWISLSVAGFKISSKFKKRDEIFESLILFTENLSCEINYLARPVNEIISEMHSSDYCSELEFIKLCNFYLSQGEDFPVAWKKGIEESNMPFSDDEKHKIISLGQSIGKTDISGQKSILKIYSEIFDSLSKRAKKDKEKYYSTSLIGCFLCGCALFIMLI